MKTENSPREEPPGDTPYVCSDKGGWVKGTQPMDRQATMGWRALVSQAWSGHWQSLKPNPRFCMACYPLASAQEDELSKRGNGCRPKHRTTPGGTAHTDDNTPGPSAQSSYSSQEWRGQDDCSGLTSQHDFCFKYYPPAPPCPYSSNPEHYALHEVALRTPTTLYIFSFFPITSSCFL